MKSFRLWAFGFGLMAAAALVFASPQAFAKERDGFRASAYSLDINPNAFADAIGALSVLGVPADYRGIAARYSTDGGTELIDLAKTPAPYAGAILATTQAGWRSGRLRKLSAG